MSQTIEGAGEAGGAIAHGREARGLVGVGEILAQGIVAGEVAVHVLQLRHRLDDGVGGAVDGESRGGPREGHRGIDVQGAAGTGAADIVVGGEYQGIVAAGGGDGGVDVEAVIGRERQGNRGGTGPVGAPADRGIDDDVAQAVRAGGAGIGAARVAGAGGGGLLDDTGAIVQGGVDGAGRGGADGEIDRVDKPLATRAGIEGGRADLDVVAGGLDGAARSACGVAGVEGA